jgi:peptide/nickel transport system substrate-binding protein
MSEKSNMSRRSFLKATGGTASAVALTGTAVGQETTPEGTETGQETQAQGGELNLIGRTITSLDPIRSTDTAGGRVIQQMFDGLMNYPQARIEIEQLLAQDYQVADDFTTYTFNLKEGATFHNGTEVTAQDFVYAWERLAGSPNSRRAYFILDSLGVQHETTTETTDEGEEEEVYQPGTLAVRAQDDYTLQFDLNRPFHAALEMLAYTAFAAVPEGLIGDVEGYDGEMEHQEFSTSNPIGAGPFQFESWSSNDEASVTRFDDYHGQVASVDRVHWRIIEDSNAHFTYAMNRNADAFEIPTQFYDPNLVSVEETDDLGREIGTYGPVRNDETLGYLSVATINAFYVGFNTNSVEKPARQAAAYAMNQQDVLDQIFKGRGEPAYHFTPPNIWAGGPDQYTQHAEQNYPYGYNQTQIDQARQVMEEAGYGENNRYQFTMTVYESSDTWEDVAILLRDQLASAHIDMQVESAPFSTLLQRGRNGELEAYSLGWIMDWPAPDNFLQLLNPPQTDTSQQAPISYTNWSGTDAAEQATQAWEQVQNNLAPTDEAQQARNEAYVQIEEANWEDVTFLPTYHEALQWFNYDWVDMPAIGAAGDSRMKHNTTTVESPDN